MDFLFGPVPSRRLGLSLGINIIPFKVCSYRCIYCEVGKTTELTIERKSFFDVDAIKREFEENISRIGKIDFVTFSGSGEPTLNADIGDLIRFVKGFGYKTAVLTNGSLMWRDDVKSDLYNADVVIPSLDAAEGDSFLRINRPHPSLDLTKIIHGIADFTHSFRGEVWLEILLVKGVNDNKRNIDSLIDAISMIAPNRVQIGTVDRPPTLPWAEKVDFESLQAIADRIKKGIACDVEVIGGFDKENDAFEEDKEKAILKLINIRPCSRAELMKIFGIGEDELEDILQRFSREGKAFEYSYGGKDFITGSMARIAGIGLED
ncbi:radical SAM protein [Hippea sp. KM1]|uniref:radical SAM protein n=1 Tax=Hippea sp. KM1 TaxID=944481 RepID=UPI00046D1FF3|nr:radical SAM protein [Hippea sp. KM1]